MVEEQDEQIIMVEEKVNNRRVIGLIEEIVADSTLVASSAGRRSSQRCRGRTYGDCSSGWISEKGTQEAQMLLHHQFDLVPHPRGSARISNSQSDPTQNQREQGECREGGSEGTGEGNQDSNAKRYSPVAAA